MSGKEELESVSGWTSSDLVLAIGGFAELVEVEAEAEVLVVPGSKFMISIGGFAELVEADDVLAVLGSKFMPWSMNPESEPLPLCLRAAPRLNCSTKALNCSLPEVARTTELENLDRPTHENSSSSILYLLQCDQIPIRRRTELMRRSLLKLQEPRREESGSQNVPQLVEQTPHYPLLLILLCPVRLP
jgi:hypothetical protein